MNNQETLLDLSGRIENSLFSRLEKEFPEKNKEFFSFCTQLASKSFLAFISAHLKHQFNIKPFHRLIAEVYEEVAKPDSKIKRVIISAPPRAGKSLLAQYYVAWLCGLNDKTSNIFASYGQRLSTKFMAKVGLIIASEEYKLCFPDFPGFMTSSKTMFISGGSIFGTSVGGALTGMDAGTLELNGLPSPGIAIVDDPLKSGDSLAELDSLEAWFTDEFNTRRTGNWRQAVIATRFSPEDLHAIVLKLDGQYDSVTNTEGWLYLNLPALCKVPSEDLLGREFNESIWEDHPTLNTKELLKLEAIDELKFNTIYQGSPTLSTGNFIKLEQINKPEKELTANCIILAIDCAAASTQASDNTAFTVAGLGPNNTSIILEQIAGKYSLADCILIVKDLLVRYAIEEIAIEYSAMGHTLIPELINNYNDCNPEYVTVTKLMTSNYGNKIQRLKYVAAEHYTDTWPEAYEELKNELVLFPKAKNDDRVDSLVWALIRLKSLRPIYDDTEAFGYGGGDGFDGAMIY
jgi:hypothetical protein